MRPTLLVLAAGMGSRYGGLKQMDPIGPAGETIIDYSVYDAVKAGFGKVVYIVRESFRDEFEREVRRKYAGARTPDGEKVEFGFVTQELGKIPDGFTFNSERVKPWGTAHAVLMAKDTIDTPFAVINGDDYYGKESFRILGDWLRSPECGKDKYSMVGFRLANTLSPSGGVSRGICRTDTEGFLSGVVENHELSRKAGGNITGHPTGEEDRVYPDSTLVSMNMWGFTPDYFEESEEMFRDFLKEKGGELKSEFYIPTVIDRLIHSGKATCKVLETPCEWFGVTFKEDRPMAVAKFKELTDKGLYPSPLFNASASE